MLTTTLTFILFPTQFSHVQSLLNPNFQKYQKYPVSVFQCWRTSKLKSSKEDNNNIRQQFSPHTRVPCRHKRQTTSKTVGKHSGTKASVDNTQCDV